MTDDLSFVQIIFRWALHGKVYRLVVRARRNVEKNFQGFVCVCVCVCTREQCNHTRACLLLHLHNSHGFPPWEGEANANFKFPLSKPIIRFLQRPLGDWEYFLDLSEWQVIPDYCINVELRACKNPK